MSVPLKPGFGVYLTVDGFAERRVVAGRAVLRLPSLATNPFGSVRSYSGPVSVHSSSIVIGVPGGVVTALSGQSGLPSGAQSGLPSKLFEPASSSSRTGEEAGAVGVSPSPAARG